ncbi:MAG: hypothetical protein WAN70_11710 [Terriglobales bacterium]|jgi:hypothetical protein
MRVLKAIGLAGLLVCWLGAAMAAKPPASLVTLDSGFRFLYDLDFDHAHQAFAAWQQQYPENPLGPACEAAALLFSEFNRLGVLESQFYQDDKAFDARRQFTPDPALRDRFSAALDQAEKWAQARLARDARNRDGLFAMTMAAGLRADYAALIEKRNLASLRFTRQATGWAQQLLAVDPNCYDAHLATGVSQYIVGSMAAPVRWLVRLGGVSGDKAAGIRELQVTADRGQYLAPFARILLAIAYVRDKEKARARELLVALQNDFPQNPLFGREISRLDGQR